MPDPASLQPWLLIVLYVATVALVWRRSVVYRRFVMILMGILCLIWWGLSAQLPPVVGWVFVALQILTASHFVRLVHARLRSVPYRALLTIPAHWFAASTVLALPFAVAAALGYPTPLFVVAYLIGGFGVYQSLSATPEVIDLDLDRRDRGPLAPLAIEPARDPDLQGRRFAPEPERLRVVQITDPHLGPRPSSRPSVSARWTPTRTWCSSPVIS